MNTCFSGGNPISENIPIHPMNLRPITLHVHTHIQPQAGALIIPVMQGDGLERQLSGIAARFKLPASLLQTDFKADLKEISSVYADASFKNLQKIYLLGLGRQPGSMETLKGFRNFFFQQRGKLPAHVGIEMDADFDATHVEAAVNGSLLGGYNLNLYKTEPEKTRNFFHENPVLDIYVDQESVPLAEKAVQAGRATAETQMRVMDLVNAPGNHKTPQTLADWAKESGEKYGFDVQVIQKEQLLQMGMHALLAVNKGSEHPPVMIVMEYKPQDSSVVGMTNKKTGLVGKGVTFDTGGISLKDSTNMHQMKSDMGGAAAVLGIMELAAKLQLPVHLVGVIPSTENSVDGNATKPGDVIGSYAGKTIEVIDTDAEGRLILADALAYIVDKHRLDVLIDLATLTGSVIGTLGFAAAGLFAHNDELAAGLLKAGTETGEKLWRLPLWDDYKDEVKSDVADVKNYHGKPFAGAIVAAKFLEVFTNQHPAWAHLDIAGTAFADSEFGTQKNATAYGVRLLKAFLSHPVSEGENGTEK